MSDGEVIKAAFIKELCFRGTHFLNSVIQTFYGPGQKPTASPCIRLNQLGNEITGVYQPPTTWPAKGTLLRHPQVAWLSLGMPFFNTTYTYSYDAFEVAYSGGPTAVTISPAGTTGGGDFIDMNRAVIQLSSYGPEIRDHPELIEHGRVKLAFIEAKSRIESIRPHRTWITIIDWYDDGWSSNQAYALINNILHLTAPYPSDHEYFACDFVHIYVGAPLEDKRHAFNDWERINHANETDWTTVGSTGQALIRLSAARSIFRTFKIVVYTPGGAYDPPPAYPDPDPPTKEHHDYPPLPPPDLVGEFVYPPGETFWLGGSESEFDLPRWEYPPGGGILLSPMDACAADAADRAALIQAGLNLYTENTLTYFTNAAASFGHLNDLVDDIEIAGNYSSVDVESIVNKIAAIFGFDPDTGADLD